MDANDVATTAYKSKHNNIILFVLFIYLYCIWKYLYITTPGSGMNISHVMSCVQFLDEAQWLRHSSCSVSRWDGPMESTLGVAPQWVHLKLKEHEGFFGRFFAFCKWQHVFFRDYTLVLDIAGTRKATLLSVWRWSQVQVAIPSHSIYGSRVSNTPSVPNETLCTSIQLYQSGHLLFQHSATCACRNGWACIFKPSRRCFPDWFTAGFFGSKTLFSRKWFAAHVGRCPWLWPKLRCSERFEAQIGKQRVCQGWIFQVGDDSGLTDPTTGICNQLHDGSHENTAWFVFLGQRAPRKCEAPEQIQGEVHESGGWQLGGQRYPKVHYISGCGAFAWSHNGATAFTTAIEQNLHNPVGVHQWQLPEIQTGFSGTSLQNIWPFELQYHSGICEHVLSFGSQAQMFTLCGCGLDCATPSPVSQSFVSNTRGARSCSGWGPRDFGWSELLDPHNSRCSGVEKWPSTVVSIKTIWL